MTFAQPSLNRRLCDHCECLFSPFRPMQRVCSPVCARRVAEAKRKAEKEQTKARRAALETIPDLITAAQKAFNAYIRERDKDLPCICCGHELGAVSGSSTGGQFDCGHYRSTGSASHLRFDERNAHGQRKVCNRYGAGRAVDYRIGLIARIGLVHVESLESDNTVRKWTREDLIAIRATYKEKLKALKALQE